MLPDGVSHTSRSRKDSAFHATLDALNSLDARSATGGNRNWLFVAYDQLSDALGPLSREPPETLGIVVVENLWKARRRPYHKQKLANVLCNLRHFAIEQARRGVAVMHVVGDAPYGELLRPIAIRLQGNGEARRFRAMRVMRPAERELRVDLAPLVAEGLLCEVPHDGWLTGREQFLRACGESPPYRMDAFYRLVRRETGVLMRGAKPLGGGFSFDGENRKRWPGAPSAPEPPRFEVDAIRAEVGELIERHFAGYPGRVDLTRVAASRADAEKMLAWAVDACLAEFGPYEDAMSSRSRGLFHTRLSTLINLHRLTPREVIDAVLDRARDGESDDVGLASVEGFVRQVLGWREFVHHVHEVTDGFRIVPEGVPVREAVHGAGPSFLGAANQLPRAYWGEAESGLNCLDSVIQGVIEEGYSHHITRLMVLANIATLLDVDARELTDWFWVMYADAYDWVVEPNVLGMGSFAVGDLMTTKPYVAGAAYIDRMSDYCAGCRYVPKGGDAGRACPLTRLYWAFLWRHRERFDRNVRMSVVMRAVEKRSDDEKQRDNEVFAAMVRSLTG